MQLPIFRVFSTTYSLTFVGLLACLMMVNIPADAQAQSCGYSPSWGWEDSYDVGGICYCKTTYDHNIGGIQPEGYNGKTVREICNAIESKYGQGNPSGRRYYNTVQCGHRPYNDAGDEDATPGRVEFGTCNTDTGPRWPSYNALFGDGTDDDSGNGGGNDDNGNDDNDNDDNDPPASNDINVSLVNAATDQVVSGYSVLGDGASINTAITGNALNFEAVSGVSNLNSILFRLSGPKSIQRAENAAPYVMFGHNGSDYKEEDLPQGNYTLTVSAHSGTGGGGAALATKTITFTVLHDDPDGDNNDSDDDNGGVGDVDCDVAGNAYGVDYCPDDDSDDGQNPDDGNDNQDPDESDDGQDQGNDDGGSAGDGGDTDGFSISLINANNDQVIGGYESLTDGAVIATGETGTNLNMDVDPGVSGVKSMTFRLSGTLSMQHTENVFPYALFGNSGRDYYSRELPNGSYTLVISAYSASGGSGAVLATTSLNFTVTDQGDANDNNDTNDQDDGNGDNNGNDNDGNNDNDSDSDNGNSGNNGPCTVRHSSLESAKAMLAAQCGVAYDKGQGHDCDPVGGEWMCSTAEITNGTVPGDNNNDNQNNNDDDNNSDGDPNNNDGDNNSDDTNNNGDNGQDDDPVDNDDLPDRVEDAPGSGELSRCEIGPRRVNLPEQPSVGCNVSLQNLINQAPNGSTLIVPACVYRENVTVNKSLTILAAEGATIKGSNVWSGWIQEGDSWFSQNTSDFSGLSFDNRDICHDQVSNCTAPHQVYINGRAMKQIDHDPEPGQFTINDGRIVLGENPSGKTVEVTERSEWMKITANNVTVRGFIMEHSGSRAQNASMVISGTNNVTVADNIFRYAHGSGVKIGLNTNMTFAHNEVHHNGQQGISGGDAGVNILLRANLIHNNNMEYYAAGWEAGGFKFTEVTGLIMEYNEVYENFGPGMWCDINCFDVTYRHNWVYNNADSGIFYEISGGSAKIHDNKVWNNGWTANGWGWGAGIQVSSSRETDVYSNIVAWNGSNISVISQDRSTSYAYNADTAWWNEVERVRVYNNFVATGGSGAKAVGFFQDHDGLMYSASGADKNGTSSNQYYFTQGERYEWDGGKETLSSFNSGSKLPNGSNGALISSQQMQNLLSTWGMPTSEPSHYDDGRWLNRHPSQGGSRQLNGVCN